MPFLKVQDGTEIYYKDQGTGTPVILIHGWPANADMWEHQELFLAENGYRVISYDRRGFGRSSQPFGGHDYDTFADDLAALIDKLDLHGASLVGFSMGGGEVVRYLSRHGSSRIAKAVLVSAVPPFMLKTADNPDGAPPELFAQMEEQIRKDRFAFLGSFAPKFFGRTMVKHTVSQEVLDWMFGMCSMASLKATLADLKAFSSTDFRAEMPRLQTPFLVIHGSADETVPMALSGAKSAKLLPNCEFIEYEGEPHGLFITAADRLNADLHRFISK
jgi:non-heme chloroperoxidase